MTVKLRSVGNPDYGQTAPQSEPKVAQVMSFVHASRVCREYIEANGLGGGNWDGGYVYSHDGDQIAYISYNGRIWLQNSKYFIKEEL
jgi:hypothetical protein